MVVGKNNSKNFFVGGNFGFHQFIFKGDNLIFKELLINDQIIAQEVRLISSTGEQLGIVPLSRANQIAEEENLDLVMMSSTSNPPVCKIMDYGKYRFDAIKKEKELKKNQKIVELKEIQLSLTIDKHDIEYRAKQGNKVKLVLRMRGRQQAFVNNAIAVVNNFYELLKENGTIEKQPEVNGRNIFLIVNPKNK